MLDFLLRIRWPGVRGYFYLKFLNLEFPKLEFPNLVIASEAKQSLGILDFI